MEKTSKLYVGKEILDITGELIKHKQEGTEDSPEAKKSLKQLYNIFKKLGKVDEFTKAKDWLAYINSVVKEIFEEETGEIIQMPEEVL